MVSKGKLVFLGILPFVCATETSTYDSFAWNISEMSQKSQGILNRCVYAPYYST